MLHGRYKIDNTSPLSELDEDTPFVKIGEAEKIKSKWNLRIGGQKIFFPLERRRGRFERFE